MSNTTKPQKPKPRRHRELFDTDTPYQHKIQRDRTKYSRTVKHKTSLEDQQNE